MMGATLAETLATSEIADIQLSLSLGAIRHVDIVMNGEQHVTT